MADMTVERVVDDVSVLKALADPIRLTLLDLTMGDPERTWTARELAVHVGVLPTNIYYHLNMLERQELLQVRDTRVVNGIIEKHYGAGQLNLIFHRRSGEVQDGLREGIAATINKARDEIDAGLASGAMSANRDAPDTERMIVSSAVVRIPDTEVANFRDELLEMVHRYKRRKAKGRKFTVLISLHPS